MASTYRCTAGRKLATDQEEMFGLVSTLLLHLFAYRLDFMMIEVVLDELRVTVSADILSEELEHLKMEKVLL